MHAWPTRLAPSLKCMDSHIYAIMCDSTKRYSLKWTIWGYARINHVHFFFLPWVRVWYIWLLPYPIAYDIHLLTSLETILEGHVSSISLQDTERWVWCNLPTRPPRHPPASPRGGSWEVPVSASPPSLSPSNSVPPFPHQHSWLSIVFAPCPVGSERLWR